MALRLGSIVEALGGELLGDPDLLIRRLAPLETAGPSDLSFLGLPKYRQQLTASQAGCVIVAPEFRNERVARGACIVTPQPHLYFARVTQLWKRSLDDDHSPRVHPSAVVHPTAKIDSTARIGALCVVERDAVVGGDTWLASRVTVGEGCVIGARCIIHSGAVIGADGFGFAADGDRWEKIEQLGGVRIGNDVEIGANTCIDRGALDDTVIEDGVKLDNLIQIGHNVHIGRNAALAGCVGVAGSTTIGARCTVGGAGMILGHLTLADDVHISAATVVMRSITRPGQYTGIFPADENSAWEKNAATLRQLHGLRDRLKALEKNQPGPTPS